MSTYTITLASGQELSLNGDRIEIDPEAGVVSLRSGKDAYNFFRECVLYWTVSNDLTPRQIEILNLMAAGKTNPAIARSLGYSESTVRQESMAIYKSLQVSGRDEAIRVGIETGLIEFEEKEILQPA